MVDFRNAAPMVRDLGTRDSSIQELPITPLRQPQHCPVFYIFAASGPAGSTFIDFDQVALTQLYGDQTFDPASPYFTHVTPYLQAAAAAGNNCVVRRIVPTDANDVANVVLSLQIVGDPTGDTTGSGGFPPLATIQRKTRNVDGSFDADMEDSSSDPVNVQGYTLRWVVSTTAVSDGSYTPGAATVKDDVAGTRDYPIFEFYARYQGSRGNLTGVRLWAANQSDLVDFPQDLFESTNNFPYYFSLIRTVNADTGRVNIVSNNFAANTSRFLPEPGVRDPLTSAVNDMPTIIDRAYLQTGQAYNANDLGGVFVYEDNLAAVLEALYDAEAAVVNVDAEGDPILVDGNPTVEEWGAGTTRDVQINSSETNHYALNILTFTNSDGSPYQALRSDPTGGVALSHATNIFLQSGSDGTMSLAALDEAVELDMENYQNSNHVYQDLVKHPESIIYDSGFGHAAKDALCKFLSRRKDTAVVLSAFVAGGAQQDLATQEALGINLKNQLALYPESATFGTGVARGMVMLGSGYIIGSNYNERVSTSYDIMVKAARYMGAADGAWRNGFAFDHAPGSVINTLRDVDIDWVPAATRTAFWTSGLNYPLSYQVRTAFFPALKTVYENDTSVLNSFITIIAICYLNKVAHAAWREFSGASRYTNAQLEERVNDFVNRQIVGKFDNRFRITPRATVTEEDAIRGYSWTLPIELRAPNMKTVMTTYIDAFRLDDADQV